MNADQTVTYTPYAGFHGVDEYSYTLSNQPGGIAVGTVRVHVMALGTWTGTAGNGDWHTGSNWHDGNVPNSMTTAVFDGTCSSGCSVTIGGPVDVRGLELGPGFAGTVTQTAGASINIGTLGFHQSAGTFLGGSGPIVVDDDLSVTGGTFRNTSGILTVSENLASPGRQREGASE